MGLNNNNYALGIYSIILQSDPHKWCKCSSLFWSKYLSAFFLTRLKIKGYQGTIFKSPPLSLFFSSTFQPPFKDWPMALCTFNSFDDCNPVNFYFFYFFVWIGIGSKCLTKCEQLGSFFVFENKFFDGFFKHFLIAFFQVLCLQGVLFYNTTFPVHI